MSRKVKSTITDLDKTKKYFREKNHGNCFIIISSVVEEKGRTYTDKKVFD